MPPSIGLRALGTIFGRRNSANGWTKQIISLKDAVNGVSSENETFFIAISYGQNVEGGLVVFTSGIRLDIFGMVAPFRIRNALAIIIQHSLGF